MAGGSSQKASLSKNVLQMKFMQRSVLRLEKEQNEEDNKREIDEEHWVLDIPATEKLESKYVFEPSMVRIERLRFGRMSFNGFNPEIEKLMKIHNRDIDLEAAAVKEKETSVNDEEMAVRYQSLFGTIAKKFSKKRSRGNIEDDQDEEETVEEDDVPPIKKKKKSKFLKPSDD